jgi:hypothetical protein
MNIGIRKIMIVAAAASIMGSANAYEKVTTGGILGNGYASTMSRVDDVTMRITTRKQISGDLEEVNKPGTTMYNTLVAVQNAATVRAAVEAEALGYKVLEVEGSRDLSKVQEKRAASSGPTPATGFTFAPGFYHNDVELAIEIVVKAVPGDVPAVVGPKTLDVEKILKAFNIK